MPDVIDNFEGEYRFLSNFSEEGGLSPSVEHWYQAMKTLDEADADRIMGAATPGKAKKLGRKVELRPDWEDIKLPLMRALLQKKFAEPEVQAKLLATGDAKLVEGNWWGDTFWGECDGVGQNWLGRLLERVRASLNTPYEPIFIQEKERE